MAAKNIENETIAATAFIAKQVAHDIRSPLTALNLVAGSLKDISEDRRLMIRNAIQRINDIANDLLSRSKSEANKIIQRSSSLISE